MESSTGIIPEDLMFPERRQEVYNYLLSAPLPSANKCRLLQGWSQATGVKFTPQEYRLLGLSGAELSGQKASGGAWTNV